MKTIQLISFIFVLLFAGFALSQEDATKTGYIDVDGGKLYYEMAGAGDETIVLVHDGIVHSIIWDNQFKKYSKKYKVVRYDRRGYGMSPKPKKKYSDIEDLYSVFSSLNIDKAILAGISSGGKLVMNFTIAHPEKVSNIILVGAVVGGFPWSDFAQTRGGRLTPEYYADNKKLLDYYIREDPYILAEKNRDIKEKLWQQVKDYSKNMDIETAMLQTPPEKLTIDYLNEIKVPALIVLGEYDLPDVFVHAGVIEWGIPNAQRVIIPDAGHLVPYEQPEAFNKQFKRFFERIEFFKVFKNEGISAAVELYKNKMRQDKSYHPFTEVQIYELGYKHLMEKKLKDAIGLFEIYVTAYPESADGYALLGEAYMLNGNKEPAVENFKKSLVIYPGNIKVKENLEKLK